MFLHTNLMLFSTRKTHFYFKIQSLNLPQNQLFIKFKFKKNALKQNVSLHALKIFLIIHGEQISVSTKISLVENDFI